MKTDILDSAMAMISKFMELKKRYEVEPKIPDGKGALKMRIYTAEKVESITFGQLGFFDCRFNQNVEMQTIAIFSADEYDLPIYEVDFIEGTHVIFFSTDLYPTDDIVTNPSYREKYLDALNDYWLRGRDILTGEVIQPIAALRAINSPYGLRGFVMPKYATTVDDTLMPSDWGRKNLVEVALGYLSVWLDDYKIAEKIDEEAKKRIQKRRGLIRQQWAKYESGIEVMKRAWGENIVKGIISGSPLAGSDK
jgi:hypothetical protein